MSFLRFFLSLPLLGKCLTALSVSLKTLSVVLICRDAKSNLLWATILATAGYTLGVLVYRRLVILKVRQLTVITCLHLNTPAQNALHIPHKAEE